MTRIGTAGLEESHWNNLNLDQQQGWPHPLLITNPSGYMVIHVAARIRESFSLR